MIDQELRNVCIIEDEQDLSEAMKSYFEAIDFEVVTYGSAEEFFDARDKEFSGIYLVDWNLPGESGISIVKKIRIDDEKSPIFMVSAYSRLEEKIEGLTAGADDYITKPFSFDELTLRMQNALRKLEFLNKVIEGVDKGVKLIPEVNSFTLDGTTISLTSREYTIFDFLYSHSNEPVTREQLIGAFSSVSNMTERNIDVHVFSLRKRIKTVNFSIDTVWGKGYKLNQMVVN